MGVVVPAYAKFKEAPISAAILELSNTVTFTAVCHWGKTTSDISVTYPGSGLHDSIALVPSDDLAAWCKFILTMLEQQKQSAA